MINMYVNVLRYVLKKIVAWDMHFNHDGLCIMLIPITYRMQLRTRLHKSAIVCRFY